MVARLPGGSKQWTAAATVAKRDGYSDQNPVLFYDNSTAILHLFHSQAAANSGEAAAEIMHLSSRDGGASWSPSEPYFTKAGDFPRNRIIRRRDGRLLFPYYSQGKGHPNWSVMGISAGRSVGGAAQWKASVVQGSEDLVQPSVVRDPKRPEQLVCFFRDRRAKNIYRATSDDEGFNWTAPAATPLPNNNAGIEANTLVSGNIVIVFNPQTSGRDPLAVAVSTDGGKTSVLPHPPRPPPHQRPAQVAAPAGHSAWRQRQRGRERVLVSHSSPNERWQDPHHVCVCSDAPRVCELTVRTDTYLRATIKYVVVTEEWIGGGGGGGGGWHTTPGKDACPDGAGCTLAGTTATLGDCAKECAKVAGCTIYDHNSHSGHCYVRTDGHWAPEANPRVTSSCMASAVKGC